MYNLVMIIDDLEIHAYAAEIMIKRAGFCRHTVAFTEATEALAFLSTNPSGDFPDMIFVDIQMPGMGGFAFLDKFLEIPMDRRKECSVAMLSSSRLPADLEKLKSYPFVSFFEKPLTKENLAGIASPDAVYNR
jgi:CheY-like chemotaxis protein